MLLANHIAGFLNQLFSRTHLKQPHFLHADTSSQKQKVDQIFLVCGQSGLWTHLQIQ